MTTPDASRQRFREAMAYLASFTDYEQILLHAPLRSTFDLGRLRRLLARLGDPHLGRPVVHVTGTKGKSTVTMVSEALLRGHGLVTFRFISPHVERVQERLAIDGQEISEAGFADLVDRLRPHIEHLRAEDPSETPSFFEVMTVMGFSWAAERDAGVLVVEVGLGGRLDATNVVDPTVAVITSIGLDHVRLLGDTHDLIAREKAGILKPGRPAILGLAPGAPGFDVLARRAAELGCPLLHPGRGLAADGIRPGVREDGGPSLAFDARVEDLALEGLELRAGAPHQAWNALLALAAARQVLRERGRDLEPSVVARVLQELDLPARAEWIPGDPPVLLDGAHTRESVADLLAVARRVARGGAVHALCGLTRDREPARVLGPLLDAGIPLIVTRIPSPRSHDVLELRAALEGPGRSVQAEPDLATALRRVRESAPPGGIVLVTGSLYLAGACRTLLKRS